MTRMLSPILFLLLTLLPSAFAQVSAVPPLMNFQGRLTRPNGTPISNGNYSVRFSLWTAASGGIEQWNQTQTVTVRNGTFAVLLSGFAAGTFDSNLWLEIKIGTNAPLQPRQQVVSVAFAMKANTVPDNAITSAKIVDGTIKSVDIANGTITVADLAVGTFNSLAWLLNGNSGVTQGFLGTTDNHPLQLRVNSKRAVQYAFSTTDNSDRDPYESINVTAGAYVNYIDPSAVGATIAGGGKAYFSGNAAPNTILANIGTIGGGADNFISSEGATIAGGQNNVAFAPFAVIGGGEGNVANDYYDAIAGGFGNFANGFTAAIGGGSDNVVNGSNSVITGGLSNHIGGESASIGGGDHNQVIGFYATIGGGSTNTVMNDYASIGGGGANLVAGFAATIAGGWQNKAVGDFSFAAGKGAQANHTGTFVWSDSQEVDFMTTAANQFLIRASNGVGVNTNNPAGYTLFVNGSVAGVGTYNNVSDLRYKTNIAPLACALDIVLALRGVSFEWKQGEVPNLYFNKGKQVGFIAQEVEKVLPELVTTDANGYKSIAYANMVPVLVEAVKTLKAEKDSEVNALRAENAELKARLEELVKAVAAIRAERK